MPGMLFFPMPASNPSFSLGALGRQCADGGVFCNRGSLLAFLSSREILHWLQPFRVAVAQEARLPWAQWSRAERIICSARPLADQQQEVWHMLLSPSRS